MAYNDFTLDMLIAQFHLQVREEGNGFAEYTPLPISDLLQQLLRACDAGSLVVQISPVRGEESARLTC